MRYHRDHEKWVARELGRDRSHESLGYMSVNDSRDSIREFRKKVKCADWNV